MIDLTNEIGYGTGLCLTGGRGGQTFGQEFINDSFLEMFIFN